MLDFIKDLLFSLLMTSIIILSLWNFLPSRYVELEGERVFISISME